MKKRITVSLLFMLMLLIFPNATQGALDVKNKTSNESVTTHQKLKENSKTKKRNFRKWLKRNFSKIKFKRKRKTETDIIIKRKANISLILAMLSIGLPLLYFFFGSLFLIISPIVLSLLGVHLSKQTL